MAGAVTMTMFASGNDCAIFETFHVAPKSPFHVELMRSATSSALAWESLNTFVEMRRFLSSSSALRSASSFAFAAAAIFASSAAFAATAASATAW